MFLSVDPYGQWGPSPVCAGCGQAIAASQPCERIHFAANAEFDLHRINGIYHAECAAPFKTVIRAMNALRRVSF